MTTSCPAGANPWVERFKESGRDHPGHRPHWPAGPDAQAAAVAWCRRN